MNDFVVIKAHIARLWKGDFKRGGGSFLSSADLPREVWGHMLPIESCPSSPLLRLHMHLVASGCMEILALEVAIYCRFLLYFVLARLQACKYRSIIYHGIQPWDTVQYYTIQAEHSTVELHD